MEFPFDEPGDGITDDAAPWDVDARDETAEGAYADDVLDQLIALERHRSQIAALEASLLVRIAGAQPQHRQVTVLDPASDAERLLDIADEVREEVAAALRRSPSTVHDQLVAARLLFGPLRRTRDALAEGRITEAHAREVADGAEVLHRSLGSDPRVFQKACEALQDRVLARAEHCTRAQLRRVVRAAVAAIDAAGEVERRRRARARVDVCSYPEGDGLAVLMARLSAVDAARVLAAVNAVAASDALTTPCDATLGQRRAAALLALVTGTGLVTGTAPAVQVRTEIQVTVPLADLVDAVAGCGPIASLLDDPQVPVSLRRLVTDPLTGRALDLGRRRYEVSEPLRRWIVARDRTCRAHRGVPDGEGSGSVGAVRKRRAPTRPSPEADRSGTGHHQLKTHAGWQVRRDDDSGLTIWTSPAGRTYWVDPDPPPV